MLCSGEGEAAVRGAIQRFVELGVGGVPFFIFGNSVAVSGAQEPQVLLEAMGEVVQRDNV